MTPKELDRDRARGCAGCSAVLLIAVVVVLMATFWLMGCVE